MTRVLVLLSGGLDSVTCLALAVDKYGVENVKALGITYGQKSTKELKSAKDIADYYKVPYEIIDISQAMLHSDSSVLQHGQPKGAEDVESVVVPFRNGVFLSVATTYALCKECNLIYSGAHAYLREPGCVVRFPDCTAEFVTGMSLAIYEGSGHKVRLEAPFLNCTKTQLVKKGLELKVPYHLTWSCFENGDKACGVCYSCLLRIKSFEENGVKDPIAYK